MSDSYQKDNIALECGFGMAGYCCSVCQAGPCRINPFDREKARTNCGFTHQQVKVAQILYFLLAEAGDYIPSPKENQGKSGCSELGDLVLKVLSWISRGSGAVVDEGMELIVGLSSALFSLRYASSASEGPPHVATENKQQPGKQTVVVPAGRKSKSLSTVIGLAAAGYMVKAQLPYPLSADRDLMKILGKMIAGTIEEPE